MHYDWIRDPAAIIVDSLFPVTPVRLVFCGLLDSSQAGRSVGRSAEMLRGYSEPVIDLTS